MADARHHYVPQFHLRQFGHADGNGRIWTYDKETDAISRRSVKAVASEINYYRIRDGAGGHSDDLEGFFSYIESAAAPLIRRLARLDAGDHHLHPVHRDTLAGYLALLHVRGPTERRKTLAMGEFLARAQVDMLLRNRDAFRAHARKLGDKSGDEALEKHRTRMLADLESGRIVLEGPEEWGLIGIGTAVEHVRPLLTSMKWRILRRRRLPFVVIGDAPVSLMAPAGHPPLLGVGFASAEVEVGLPLSPDALLVMTHEPDARDIEVIDLDGHPLLPRSLRPSWATVMNAYSMLRASRYVFGRSQADLEFTRISLSDEQRRSEPKVAVMNIPPEWRYLMPDAFDAPGE